VGRRGAGPGRDRPGTAHDMRLGGLRVIRLSTLTREYAGGAAADVRGRVEWGVTQPGHRPVGAGGNGAFVSRRTARLLVVDSQPIVYAGVSHIAAGTSWLAPVGYASTGREAIAAAATVRPDMVLLDVRLPDMLAPELIQALRSRTPEIKVVVFTAYSPSSALYAAVESLADGVVRKEADAAELVETMRRVHCEERVGGVDDDAAQARDARMGGLTRREYEILRRVAMGETNVEIARAVGLTSNTVKTYFQRTLEKLGARNRVEALIQASEIGLL
jgi:DNA-binding NarL/FixJ family response regulator